MAPPGTARSKAWAVQFKEDIDYMRATEGGAQLLSLIGEGYMSLFDTERRQRSLQPARCQAVSQRVAH
eukprot:2944170-Pyramimonas_sp.AAC.1